MAGIVPNMNPAAPYGDYRVIYKPGYVVHIGNVEGPIGNNASSSKKGRECTHSALSLASWGDSSVESIKTANGITKVASIDYEILGVLAGVLYQRNCTIVAGE